MRASRDTLYVGSYLYSIVLAKMCPNVEDYVTKCHQCWINKAQWLKADVYYILWMFLIINGKLYLWIFRVKDEKLI